METDSSLRDSHTPVTEHMLPVGDGHTLHVETFGNRDGVPALFLHGGPGGGCQPSHRALFDPARFHAVLFDQRGAGRSLPTGSRAANSTDHLIGDIEAIRKFLGIKRWMLVGGSWGATLALAYAQSHPERVSAMVLRAVFLGTRTELNWAFGTAMSTFYPGLHSDFLEYLPPDERARPLENYWRRILDPDPEIHRPAAFAWYQAERILSLNVPPATRLAPELMPGSGEKFPSSPYMEAHYFSNDCFLSEGQLLANAKKLERIPGRVVQGRYDLLCPPATSASLAAVWPNAHIVSVASAGHSQWDDGITAALTQCIDEMAVL